MRARKKHLLLDIDQVWIRCHKKGKKKRKKGNERIVTTVSAMVSTIFERTSITCAGISPPVIYIARGIKERGIDGAIFF